MIGEDGEVYRLDHTRLICSFSQLAIVAGQLTPQVETSLLRCEVCKFVRLLLAPGLHGEICLADRYNLFCGISVLNDQVTSVARHMHILDFALASFTDSYHIAHASEMILNHLSAVLTCYLGLL